MGDEVNGTVALEAVVALAAVAIPISPAPARASTPTARAAELFRVPWWYTFKAFLV
jgi:hypothetical protein